MQPAVWPRVAVLYDGDEIWHLGVLGALGLMVLSLTMMGVFFAGSTRVGRMMSRLPLSPLPHAAAAYLALVACLSIAPQIYYSYYLLLIPGLPLQWVIAWPDAADLIRAIRFEQDGRLADHFIAAALWSAPLHAVLLSRHQRRRVWFAIGLGLSLLLSL
ncbi:MAG: hypothetical protein AAF401_03345 [Pseudomonadota bacterium]